MGNLLDTNADEREDAVLLPDMEECFARWSRLDETLSTMSSVLTWNRR